MTEDIDDDKKLKKTLKLGGILSLKGGSGGDIAVEVRRSKRQDALSPVQTNAKETTESQLSENERQARIQTLSKDLKNNDRKRKTKIGPISSNSKKTLKINEILATSEDHNFRSQKIYWNLSKAVNKNSQSKELIEKKLNIVLSTGKIISSSLRNKFIELREKNNLRPPTPPKPWLTNICRNSKGDILLKIEKRDIEKALQSGEAMYVRNIKAVKIFYCYYGRNAWYSTWVQQYTPDCMHLTLESAKNFAERQRKQGSVFYIAELPALQIESGDNPIFITQINENDPLSKYSTQVRNKCISAITKKIDMENDNYFIYGASLEGLINSFYSNSLFWSVAPNNNNHAVILCANASNDKALSVKNDALLTWQSESAGSNYKFNWIDNGGNNYHRASAIMNLAKQFQER